MSLYPTYPAIIFTDDGQYGVIFPDLAGCITTGSSLQSAIAHAGEVLLDHLELLQQHGEYIPPPSEKNTVKLPDHFGNRQYTVVMITACVDYDAERPPHY